MTDGTPVGRRVFLGLVGLGAVGVLVGANVQDFLSKLSQPVVSHDPTGLADFLPVDGFRYYSVTGDFPKKAPQDWKLTVGGLVDKPYTLTYDELLAMPADAPRQGLSVCDGLARQRREVDRRLAV